jgi:hypothetical protein
MNKKSVLADAGKTRLFPFVVCLQHPFSHSFSSTMEREELFRLFLPSSLDGIQFQPTFVKPAPPPRLDISLPSPTTEANIWDVLPDDIIIHEIFSRFGLEDLDSWGTVSRRFHKLTREAISYRKNVYNVQLQLASTASPQAFFHFMRSNNLRTTQRCVNRALWKNTDENGKLILQSCLTGYRDKDTITFLANPGDEEVIPLPVIPGASAVPPGFVISPTLCAPDEDVVLDETVQEILDTRDEREQMQKEAKLMTCVLIDRMAAAILGRRLWFFEYFGTDVMHGRAPFTQNKIMDNFLIHRDAFCMAVATAFRLSAPEEKIATLDFAVQVLPFVFNPNEIDIDDVDDSDPPEDPTPQYFLTRSKYVGEMMAHIMMNCTEENAREVFNHFMCDFGALAWWSVLDFFTEIFLHKTAFVQPAVLELACNYFDWREYLDLEISDAIDSALRRRSCFLTEGQEASLVRLIELLFVGNPAVSTWDLTLQIQKMSPGIFNCARPSLFNHLYYHSSVPSSVLTTLARQWKQHPQCIVLAMWCTYAGLIRLPANEVFTFFRTAKEEGVVSEDFLPLVSARVQAFWFGHW